MRVSSFEYLLILFGGVWVSTIRLERNHVLRRCLAVLRKIGSFALLILSLNSGGCFLLKLFLLINGCKRIGVFESPPNIQELAVI